MQQFKAEYVLGYYTTQFEKNKPGQEIETVYVSEFLRGALTLEGINKEWHGIEIKTVLNVSDFWVDVV